MVKVSTEVQVFLNQLNRSDLPRVRDLVNHVSFKPWDSDREDLEQWYGAVADRDDYFVLAVRKAEAIYRSVLTGVFLLKDVDWVARSAELGFWVVDDDHFFTDETSYLYTAVAQFLRFIFGSLNLNRVWIEVTEAHQIKPVLEKAGFVAEGVVREAVFKDGVFSDAIVCSLLKSEFQSL